MLFSELSRQHLTTSNIVTLQSAIYVSDPLDEAIALCIQLDAQCNQIEKYRRSLFRETKPVCYFAILFDFLFLSRPRYAGIRRSCPATNLCGTSLLQPRRDRWKRGFSDNHP